MHQRAERTTSVASVTQHAPTPHDDARQPDPLPSADPVRCLQGPMDPQTVTVVSVIAVVVVVLMVGLRFRSRVRARIKAPGVDMAVDGSNDPAPAVVAENVTSRAGAVKAEDATGRGVHARGIDAHKNVEISSGKPPKA